MGSLVTAPICFLTDFGLADAFVGMMKGVVLQAAPDATLVDITHDIPPHDVRAAAYQLMETVRFFPAGTLFVATVDPDGAPTAGSLYAEAGGWRFLAPDNGLLSWVFRRHAPTRVIALAAPAGASTTFAGRDVLAPAAGRLAHGDDPEALGGRIDRWKELPFPALRKLGALWEGEILIVDHFGNLVTNVPTESLKGLVEAAKVWIELPGQPPVRGIAESYAAVEKGRLLAVAGAAGFVEISVREGNAAGVTGLKAGDKVSFRFRT